MHQRPVRAWQGWFPVILISTWAWSQAGLATAGTPAADQTQSLNQEDAQQPASAGILQAEPVEKFRLAEPVGNTPAPAPQPEALHPGFGQTRVLLPYYISAYVPPVDKTEIDLGLLLSQSPGIDVALSWGAMNEMMLSAKMSALGASSTVGVGGRYLLVNEWPGTSKPAIALTLQWLFLNLRTLEEIRKNIFRGNRMQAGAVFSKDLGALAQSLEASPAIRDFFSMFCLHAQVLGEFQNGRSGVAEDSLSRAEFGARAALEMHFDEDRVFIYLTYDTIPDWPNEQNYYLGVRYFSQPDLAFDVVAGRLQNASGLLASLAWVF